MSLWSYDLYWLESLSIDSLFAIDSITNKLEWVFTSNKDSKYISSSSNSVEYPFVGCSVFISSDVLFSSHCIHRRILDIRSITEIMKWIWWFVIDNKTTSKCQEIELQATWKSLGIGKQILMIFDCLLVSFSIDNVQGICLSKTAQSFQHCTWILRQGNNYWEHMHIYGLWPHLFILTSYKNSSSIHGRQSRAYRRKGRLERKTGSEEQAWWNVPVIANLR